MAQETREMTGYTPDPMLFLAGEVAASFVAEWDDMDPRDIQAGADCFSFDDVVARAESLMDDDIDDINLDIAARTAYKILCKPASKARALIAAAKAYAPLQPAVAI